jgi:anthraniloyl-CoA monooxygenase
MSRPEFRAVSVVGAGPAGAFFALELSRLRPDVRIDLYDRRRSRAGAGIVMSREFADQVQARHPRTFDVPPSDMADWDRTRTLVGDESIWSGAFGMFGLSRRAFHEHVRALATALPNVRFMRHEVSTEPADGDVVVLADGASSRLRQARADEFGTTVASGRNVFLWMSTPAPLDPLFILRRIDPGLLIVHAYPHRTDESTFIVEADPRTLAAHDLLDPALPETEKALAAIFRDELRGATLHSHSPGWQAFRTVTNDRWHAERLVLLGDAAHTVHFSTGSGTTLAIEDAFCLAGELAQAGSVADAVRAYAAQRQPVLRAAQAEAADSMAWFERLSRRDRLRGYQTVFALRSRRQANTYGRLHERDPQFVAKTVETLAAGPTDAEPVDLPIALGALQLVRRTVPTEGDGAIRLPTGEGDENCPVVDPAALTTVPTSRLQPVPAGALVTDAPGIDLAETVRALRAAGVRAVGLLVAELDEPDQRHVSFDFLAVRSQSGPGRCARTDQADELRYATGLPVLLLSTDPLSRDEMNTLIAAGRVDLVTVPE